LSYIRILLSLGLSQRTLELVNGDRFGRERNRGKQKLEGQTIKTDLAHLFHTV
jgi:hypothetical protein